MSQNSPPPPPPPQDENATGHEAAESNRKSHVEPPAASTAGDAAEKQQAVRFSSQLEEIAPEDHSLHTTETITQERSDGPRITAEQEQELRDLSKSLQQQNSQLQKRRMSNFVFEPISLPASRVPSSEHTSRHGSVASRLNQIGGPVQTPPLTPAESGSKDNLRSPTDGRVAEITPESTGPPASGVTSSATESTRPSSAEAPSTKQTSASQQSVKQRPAALFALGGEQSPRSRDQSPSRSVGSPHSITSPAGDQSDPYARGKRPPPNRSTDGIDSRFVFGTAKDNRRHSSILSSGPSSPVPRSDSTDSRAHERQGSTGGHRPSVAPSEEHHKHHGSMIDLKRFFHFGHHHKKRDSAVLKGAAGKTGTRTPPHQAPPAAVPFAEDHGLESKYGKFGKVLGSGAGGSVRLMKRPSDGVTFAVKQFRERHPHESEREYTKKVTAEFCIGSTLHNGNIIETMDIIQERGQWYEVMEYAPFDLFATVMTGKMSREEVACCFCQIFNGVQYLHSMGLAHRDLKLDNVVVNEHGIMKIIDFGSAIVFRYPFEDGVVMATGCVGSDPYLAPEVYDSPRYDPQPTDVWSLAIIFACMSLRRFPWKAPRMSDNSYRLFASPPTPGTPSADNAGKRRSRLDVTDAGAASAQRQSRTSESSRSTVVEGGKSETSSIITRDGDARSERTETIKGPWRLLRLLPRESRHIISLMLEIDPKKRATIEDMASDSWISNISVCRQIDHGQVIKATGHTHTLAPSAAEDDSTSAKK